MASSAAWTSRNRKRRPASRRDEGDSLRALLTRTLREISRAERPVGKGSDAALLADIRRRMAALESRFEDIDDFEDFDDDDRDVLGGHARDNRRARRALADLYDRLSGHDDDFGALEDLDDLLDGLEAGDAAEDAAWDAPETAPKAAPKATPRARVAAPPLPAAAETRDKYAARLDHIESRLSEIASAVSQPPAPAYADPAPINGLGDAIRQLADRQTSLEEGLGIATDSYRTALDDRLDALASRIENRIAEEKEDLGERMKSFSSGGKHSEEYNGLVGEIRAVADRVDAVPEHSARAFERIADGIAQRIDHSTSQTIDTIRGDMERLAAEVPPGPDISSIERAIGDIAGRLDTAGHAELSGLRDEIAQLRADIAASGRVDFSGIERHLATLAEKIDASAGGVARGDDTAVLQAVERRIAKLSEEIERARETGGSADLEKAFVDLSRRIDASRSDAIEAARQAAEAVAGKLMASATPGSAPDQALIQALQNEIRQLRQSADQSDRRTQDTLEAVHDTLRKIVDRLSYLEREVDDVVAQPRRADPAAEAATARSVASRAAMEPQDMRERDVPGPDMPARREEALEHAEPQPVPPAPGLEDAPVARKQKAEPAKIEPSIGLGDDMPIPPRTPRTGIPGLESDAGADKPAGDDKTDFIAAARRAARQAAVETAADDLDSPPKGLARLLRRKKSDAQGLAGDAVPEAPKMPGAEGGKSSKVAVYGAVALIIACGAWYGYKSVSRMLLAPAPTASAPASDPAPKATPQKAPASESAPPAAEPAKQSAVEPADQPRKITTSAIPAPAASLAQAGQRAEPEAAPAAEPVAEALPDLPEAFPPSLRQAAIDGDPLARYEIAARYADARDVPQDLKAAAKWFQLAAAQGHAPAQFRLGGMFEKGNGVARDISLAKLWYERAAEQGNRKAMHNLAVLLADNSGGKPDYPAAAGWFRRAADLGLSDSQYNLAILYARGMGVEQDLRESYKWFTVAGAAGDSEAAAKADELARRMDPQTVAQAKLAAASWKAEPLDELANATSGGTGGWTGDTTASIPMDNSAATREAQELLNRIGYDVGPADGMSGPRTRDAIRAFQREKGMAETGGIDPFLIDALRRAAG